MRKIILTTALAVFLSGCWITVAKAEFLGLHTGVIFGFKWEEDADGISRLDKNDDVNALKDMSTHSMLYGRWRVTDRFEIDAGISHLSDTFHPDDEYYKNQAFIKLQRCVGWCK